MTNLYLQRLAAATKPCPACCGGTKRVVFHPYMGESNMELGRNKDCPTCHGSGKFAVVKGLTRRCESIRSITQEGKHIDIYSTLEDGSNPVCRNCGGSGQVPVDADRAVVVLELYAISQEWSIEISTGSVTIWTDVPIAETTDWSSIRRVIGQAIRDIANAEQLAEALAAAILQAMGVKHD